MPAEIDVGVRRVKEAPGDKVNAADAVSQAASDLLAAALEHANMAE